TISLSDHFDMLNSSKPACMKQLVEPKVPTAILCGHLQGGKYQTYIDLTTTRDFGGVSLRFVARIARQILPYKLFAALKDFGPRNPPIHVDLGIVASLELPSDGNLCTAIPEWTPAERHRVEVVMREWSRWEVDYIHGFVKSTKCLVKTKNSNGICNSCCEVSHDESLKHAIRKEIDKSFRKYVKQVYPKKNVD
ncbi:hypothetical protein C0993_001352, partial [Termitomyces sp. T159_Od127]